MPKHYLTDLIIIEAHIRQLHAGLHGTISTVRENFWITSLRNTVRRVLRTCCICNRFNLVSITPLIGNLPVSRVTSTKPFLVCGVDYAGPILIKESRSRSRHLINSYIAMFVCFATKPIHLELVGDLTTESFMNSLRRLMARRGSVSDIYSDNATNFVGASGELGAFF